MTWFISVLGIILLWAYGDKWSWAPLLGMFVQVVWIDYVISTEQYGLLLGAIAFAIVHTRNFYKWRKGELRKPPTYHRCPTLAAWKLEKENDDGTCN